MRSSFIHAKNTRQILCFFIMFGLIFLFLSESEGANLTKEQLRKTISESLKAMWTGEAFSPELEQDQVVLKNMIEAGVITKAELHDLLTKETRPILKRFETTRYILLEIGERMKLFSPYLDWKAIKEDIVWKMISSELQGKDPYIIKTGTLAPAGTTWLETPNKLARRVGQLTSGTITWKIYAGGVMGEDPDVLRKMDIGQLDACGCTAFGVLEASPDAAVFMAPDLFKSYEEVDYVVNKFKERLDDSFAKRGYICAALIDTGYLYVFSKNKISTLDDLRDQKVLASMGNIETALLKELGINVIPVAIPEIVSSLSMGMGDAFIAPAAWVLGMQAYQYVNYYIKTPFLYAPAVSIISMNTKDKMSRQFGASETLMSNITELLILEVKLTEKEWKADSRHYETKSLQAFETKVGIKPVIFSPEDQRTFEAAAKRVREKLAGKEYPRDFYNDIVNALEEYRSKN